MSRSIARRAIHNVFGIAPTAVARTRPNPAAGRPSPRIDWADLDELLARGRATPAPRKRRKR
ncbi:MAG: hypothetical protein E6K82_00245 [Candidatus Rokuibacteriota bacterium]|nr:MAG: hypothetical protein E6K82_00245 [Candidatus Rokubacteria bacterium]